MVSNLKAQFNAAFLQQLIIQVTSDKKILNKFKTNIYLNLSDDFVFIE